MFKTIEKDSVPVQIVNYILDSVASGELKEDDRLPPERELCEKLGVGRSTLREALRILDMMNVLEKRIDGTYIHVQTENIIKEAISIDFAVGVTNYAELIELRNFIEVESIIQAAQNRTEEDLAVLRDICEKSGDSLGNVQLYAKYGTDFHVAIAKATHNEILSEIFEAIRIILYDYQRKNMKKAEETERSYLEHLKITEAISMQDAELCETLMRDHLDYTKDLYERKNREEFLNDL